MHSCAILTSANCAIRVRYRETPARRHVRHHHVERSHQAGRFRLHEQKNEHHCGETSNQTSPIRTAFASVRHGSRLLQVPQEVATVRNAKCRTIQYVLSV